MTRRSLPITTVAPGDAVTVHLTGRADERINTWGGEVLAVDGVAVKLAAAWYRCGLWANTAEGEKVIPWGRIDHINVEAPAGGDGGHDA